MLKFIVDIMEYLNFVVVMMVSLNFKVDIMVLYLRLIVAYTVDTTQRFAGRNLFASSG